jgi:pyridoxine 4-dehydrogenase
MPLPTKLLHLDNLTTGCKRAGWPRLYRVQNRYNVTDRSSEPVLSQCERDGTAFIPWFPLSAGSDATGVGGPIAEVAARHQATPAQVAIAWLLARTPVMLPIPGTSSLAHLEENQQAARLQLSAADRRALD